MSGRGPVQRLVEALSVVAIAVCGIAGFLGLRALAWGQDHLIPSMLVSGALLSGAVIGAVGLIYVLFGNLLLRLIAIDWLSVRFGALIGAILYAIYHTLAPLTPTEAAIAPERRALQGAVDGILIGVVLGLATNFVSARGLIFTRGGLTRYVLLFFVILLTLGIIVLVDSMVRLPDTALFFVVVPAVLALRLGVGLIDHRVSANERTRLDELAHDAAYYAETGHTYDEREPI
ncbi:MAG: hypothetical protein IPK19_18860 [Chloroflexi bacterium]|nr:hypothetical protein [Chloroflexota bacterium]